ncbi:mRNA surveillance protein pelota [Nanoarchaeota archaeon]
MQILKRHLKHGIVKVKAEDLDDLWYLSHLVEPGDKASGSTERKIKIGGDDDRKANVVRKKVFLSLEVEKIELAESLRIHGKILEGTDDVPAGSYHTINVAPGDIIQIEKKEWLKYQLSKLEEASEKQGSTILIVCHDREEAVFGMLTRRGLEELGSLKGDVSKKKEGHEGKGNFYKEIANALKEYKIRYKPSSVVVASPGFWKEYLIAELDGMNVVQASCSTVQRGLQEVVKRPELKQVLAQDRTSREALMVEEVMEAISKDSACYGLDDSEEKVNNGAVAKLLVSEKFIAKARSEEFYARLDSLMRNAERMDGEVHIVSADSEKLDSLGGVAGILRWVSQ